MSPDYSKRDYLLPEGCQDLIDVITREGLGTAQAPTPPGQSVELLVSEPVSVVQLAALLSQDLPTILANLMQIGVFAKADQNLSFESVRKVAHKYGLTAKRLPRPGFSSGWSSFDPT